MTKKAVTNPALTSWDNLNESVMNTDDERFLQMLLNQEVAGRGRMVFALRIHSRINKLRADRERAELRSKLK